MNNNSHPVRFGIAVALEKAAKKLRAISLTAESESKFVDLAPTDQADPDGIYSRALSYAISNENVRNIALTGPYGSGKSSIIRSFLKIYEGRPLHISLAAFIPESEGAGSKVSRQEIERSVLQQMLYGADANRLPLSRFKRIQSPGAFAAARSLFILIGLLSSWYIFLQRDALISGAFFNSSSLESVWKFALLAIAAAFVWMMLHRIYVASFGISLKSVSLKDIEMRPASDSPDSILNRHLDEIIYFFQNTDYDLVVIEDLDRFENTDIFVTLREINSLVNENAGVKRPIRFLYALRDDMFVNTDRTKFFEFIVPVIPIINSSNSIDMVLQQGTRLSLDARLDRQFLREVSRYLNDLRLIRNIFNEYAIYAENLDSDQDNVLDANKLLAILIYKNVYPRDFELLHRGEGNLAAILAQQEELIRQGEKGFRAQIGSIEQALKAAERQVPVDQSELRMIYVMMLLKKLPVYVTHVGINHQALVAIPQLVDFEPFDELVAAKTLVILQNGHQTTSAIGDVDPQQAYERRKTEVEKRASRERDELSRELGNLQARIRALRTLKFKELVRLDADRIDALFAAFGATSDLARFLVLEGHLDDTYYQYTSLFHSGRLSPNDNKFLIQIRAFTTPAPDFPIDNASEVIAAMRADDFAQSYVLNVKVVDALLKDHVQFATQRKSFLDYVASSFKSSEPFLGAYYTSGTELPALLSGLNASWSGLVETLISSPQALTHVAQLILHLPFKELGPLSVRSPELTRYVAEHLPQLLSQVPEVAPDRLSAIPFEVADFEAISAHPSIASFLYNKGRFRITPANIEYAFREILGENDVVPLRSANLTSLLRKDDPTLIDRINQDFAAYFVEVNLALQGNTQEEPEAIMAVLNHKELTAEQVDEFLSRQTKRLETLEGVPAAYAGLLFAHDLIKPTWANCSAYLASENFVEDKMLSYLSQERVRTELLAEPLPASTEAKPLRRFILNALSLPDSVYQQYARALPNRFDKFPDGAQASKLNILIDEKKITFAPTSFAALPDQALQLRYAAANIAEFLAVPNEYESTDEFLEGLLHEELSLGNKRAVVGLLNLSSLADNPHRAEIVGAILDASDLALPGIDAGVAIALINSSRPIAVQISLLNKLQKVLADDDVRQVLQALPRPYSDLKRGYGSPKLTKSADHLALLTWLAERRLISSFREEGLFGAGYRVFLRR